MRGRERVGSKVTLRRGWNENETLCPETASKDSQRDDPDGLALDDAEVFHLHGLQEDFDTDMTADHGSAEPDGVARANILRLRWVQGRARRQVRKEGDVGGGDGTDQRAFPKTVWINGTERR